MAASGLPFGSSAFGNLSPGSSVTLSITTSVQEPNTYTWPGKTWNADTIRSKRVQRSQRKSVGSGLLGPLTPRGPPVCCDGSAGFTEATSNLEPLFPIAPL